MASTNISLEDILNELSGQSYTDAVSGPEVDEWIAPIVSQEERIATLELKVAQLATILQHITGNEIP